MSLATAVDDFSKHLVRLDSIFPNTPGGLERYRTLMSGIFNLLFPEPNTYKPIEKAIEDAAEEYNVFPAQFTIKEKVEVAAMDAFLYSAWDQITANPKPFHDVVTEHAIMENSQKYLSEENYNDPYNRKYTYFNSRRGGGRPRRVRKSRKTQKGYKKRRTTRRV